jgi:hypothetical protein
MGSRGTTVVAWLIGLSALAAQAVIVPIAAAMLEDRAPAPVEVTAPALPATPKAEPALEVHDDANGVGTGVEVIALVR